MKNRNWVFTLNNPTQTLEWTEPVTYAVWQEEKSSTLHYQGYCEFSAPKTLQQVKEILPTAHWEPRRGSQQEAITYCMKTDSRVNGPWEYGSRKKQGTRSDLEEIKTKIQAGETEQQIAEDHFGDWCRYYRAFREYRILTEKKRTWATETFVCIGKPGSGKSHWANAQGNSIYYKQRGQWWDGYTNQEIVVIDDFYGWLPYDTLLRLCDKWPFMVETKGGQVDMYCKKVIITSNINPNQWYPNVPNWEALKRRIQHWMRFYEIGQFIDFDNEEKFLKEQLK